jgi:hypothetical protein
MKLSFPWSIGMVAALTAILCQNVAGQAAPTPAAPSADAQSREAKGVPPRAAPGDYQGHAQAGAVTIAAEFTAHSVVTAEQLLTTEDYVVVEVGLFGPPETHLKLSYADFSVRINGKKAPVMAEEYNAVFGSLKDPEWEPPETGEKKSKTSIGGNGKSDTGSLPPIVHVPIELKRAMQLRVQKASLPEGERPLPAAGLIFFPHRGKNIQSIELIYAGPAGKAAVTLHP